MPPSPPGEPPSEIGFVPSTSLGCVYPPKMARKRFVSPPSVPLEARRILLKLQIPHRPLHVQLALFRIFIGSVQPAPSRVDARLPSTIESVTEG